jgi:hypothetical protein
MKPHKHAELIKAWADGAEIEQSKLYEDGRQEPWVNFTGVWLDNFYYRIKRKPKPNVVKYIKAHWDMGIPLNVEGSNLELTFDGETGELKSAEVLK